MTTDREALAKIIDPEAWESDDDQMSPTERAISQHKVGFHRKEALRKAAAILAFLPQAAPERDNSLRGLIREIEALVHEHFASGPAHGPVQNLLDHLSAIARCHEINSAPERQEDVVDQQVDCQICAGRGNFEDGGQITECQSCNGSGIRYRLLRAPEAAKVGEVLATGQEDRISGLEAALKDREPEFYREFDSEVRVVLRALDGIGALKSPATSPALDGWKLVPVEPTKEMLDAAEAGSVTMEVVIEIISDPELPYWKALAKYHWKKMLAAAPTGRE